MRGVVPGASRRAAWPLHTGSRSSFQARAWPLLGVPPLQPAPCFCASSHREQKQLSGKGLAPPRGSPFAASTLLLCLFTQGAEAAFRQGPGPSLGPPLQPAPCFRAAGPSCCLLARGCSSAAPRSDLELVWAPSALGATRRRDCFRELLLALHGVRLGLFYTLHLSTPRRSAPTVPYLATPAQSSSLTPQRSFN